MTVDEFETGPVVLRKKPRPMSPDLEALGQWIDQFLPVGADVTSDDFQEYWEARQVAPAGRGRLLAGAVARGWLRWTGRVAHSRRPARKAAFVMVYSVARR